MPSEAGILNFDKFPTFLGEQIDTTTLESQRSIWAYLMILQCHSKIQPHSLGSPGTDYVNQAGKKGLYNQVLWAVCAPMSSSSYMVTENNKNTQELNCGFYKAIMYNNENTDIFMCCAISMFYNHKKIRYFNKKVKPILVLIKFKWWVDTHIISLH